MRELLQVFSFFVYLQSNIEKKKINILITFA